MVQALPVYLKNRKESRRAELAPRLDGTLHSRGLSSIPFTPFSKAVKGIMALHSINRRP